MQIANLGNDKTPRYELLDDNREEIRPDDLILIIDSNWEAIKGLFVCVEKIGDDIFVRCTHNDKTEGFEVNSLNGIKLIEHASDKMPDGKIFIKNLLSEINDELPSIPLGKQIEIGEHSSLVLGLNHIISSAKSEPSEGLKHFIGYALECDDIRILRAARAAHAAWWQHPGADSSSDESDFPF